VSTGWSLSCCRLQVRGVDLGVDMPSLLRLVHMGTVSMAAAMLMRSVMYVCFAAPS
jgi:hypothetical protein